MLPAADHDNGAARVVHAVLAHRAEQRLGEPAVPAAAHHQEIRTVGGVVQYLRRVAFDDSGVHGDGAAWAAFSSKSKEVAMPVGANPYPPVGIG